MTDTSQTRLRGHLVTHYDSLLSRVTARLGSRERARDALQDAFVKLSGDAVLEEVRHPTTYLFRMALNIAANSRRKDDRLLGFDEVSSLLDVPDDAADPSRVLEARSEVQIVKQVMAAMSPRRFEICSAAWLEGESTLDIAQKRKMPLRTVQHELRQASLEIQKALARPKVVALRQSGSGVS
nr:RNA polymerase sigma factor [uncultured Brevundimonas sp.]